VNWKGGRKLQERLRKGGIVRSLASDGRSWGWEATAGCISCCTRKNRNRLRGETRIETRTLGERGGREGSYVNPQGGGGLMRGCLLKTYKGKGDREWEKKHTRGNHMPHGVQTNNAVKWIEGKSWPRGKDT